MKILMTTDTVGGVWTYSLELARGLPAQHVEILLATMGQPTTGAQRRDAARIRHVEVAESEEERGDPDRDRSREREMAGQDRVAGRKQSRGEDEDDGPPAFEPIRSDELEEPRGRGGRGRLAEQSLLLR